MYIAKIFDQFKPGPNAYIAGDFNAHHGLWYAEHAVRHTNIIRTNGFANQIADLINLQKMTLTNTAGLFTHFPQSKNCSRSIVDL